MGNDVNRFAAEILDQSATALAADAVERLFQADPAARERFADGATHSWRAHLRQRVLELAVAVRMAEPRLFLSRVLWTRKAFLAREVDPSHLGASLSALLSTARERLPEDVALLVDGPIEAALAALESANGGDDGGLQPTSRHGELALRYIAHVLEGDAQKGVQIVVDAIREGMPLHEMLEEVLVPAQHEIGRMWHLAQSDVAEEHLLTATTLRAIAVASREVESAPSNGRTVLAAAVAGNEHDVPVHALSVLFETAGWRTVCLGANVPAEDVLRSVQYFGADLVVLSVTLSVQLPEAERAIAAVRSARGSEVRILVGGQAFAEGTEDLWRRIGADAHAPTLTSAVTEAARLFGPRG